jgi:chloride channel 7
MFAVCCRYTGHTLAKFIITMVSGVLTGVFAVALSSSVGALTEWKLHTIQSLLDDPGSHRIWIAFLWHWCFSCVLVVFGVALVGAHAWHKCAAHASRQRVSTHMCS